MAALNVQEITVDGVQEVLIAADVGLSDTFTNTGREYIKVNNGGGSPITVSPTVTGSISTGEQITTPLITVPAGAARFIGASEMGSGGVVENDDGILERCLLIGSWAYGTILCFRTHGGPEQGLPQREVHL